MKNGPYILVKAPKEYPGKKYRDKYVYEHHLVWWLNTNIIFPEGYIIHHKNENTTDNRFENLELISKKTHSHIHNFKNKKIPLICSFCNNPFLRSPNNFNFKFKMGQRRFYCCRSHQVLHQRIILRSSLVA